MQTDKIAVIELSTKAVKWLIPRVDNETIQNTPFSFKNFIRESQKTETGNGLDKNGVLNERYFIQRVLPFIKKAYNDVVAANVDVVYCVATAVYRSARNINSILRIIKDQVGLDVEVLTKEKEAEYTFWAYFHSTNYKDLLLRKPYTLLIDQGGGSTEITLFHEQKLVFRKSLDMGTTILKNDFFSQHDVPTLDRLKEIDRKYKKKIYDELYDINKDVNISEIFQNTKDVYCICVGTAITAAMSDGARHNSDVHDKCYDEYQLQNIIEQRTEEFSGIPMEVLQGQIENRDGKTHTLEKRLSSRLGLPIICLIINYFNVPKVIVSGTGLWYGVFLTKFYNISIE